MIEIAIPGRGNYYLEHLVLDLNGTIALNGTVIEGVEDRVLRLSKALNIHLVTADTHGNAQKIGQLLGVEVRIIDKGAEDARKFELIQALGQENTVCIGNGLNDSLMLATSAIGICVMGKEGAASETVINSDIVVNHINDALDLLLNPERLIATLRV